MKDFLSLILKTILFNFLSPDTKMYVRCLFLPDKLYKGKRCFISVRLQVLQEELEAQRARARGESTEAWGVNRTDEDKDVVRATQAPMNYADNRPTGGKNRFTRMRRRAYANGNDHYILENKYI